MALGILENDPHIPIFYLLRGDYRFCVRNQAWFFEDGLRISARC